MVDVSSTTMFFHGFLSLLFHGEMLGLPVQIHTDAIGSRQAVVLTEANR